MPAERSDGHPTTRIKQSYCYATPSSKNAKDFLINHLIPTLPFNIKSIQVDGGSEFRKYFEEACKELNIPLYVLPPYSPKYNGRIEAQSRKMMCLHNHFNLLVCEVRMERSDRQISNRTMREGVVFPANEVSGWKQAFIVIEILQNIMQN